MWRNVEFGEKSVVFSNGEKQEEDIRRNAGNGLFSVLHRGMAANGESAQVP